MKVVIQSLFKAALIICFSFSTVPAADSNGVAENSDRFIVEGTTVTDTETGLMWAAHDNGADISLFEGKAYCENYTDGGYDDWRLPTQDELATLFDLSAYEVHGYYIAPKIKITGCCLWASDRKDARVATFDFAYGNPDWGHPMSIIDARSLPVRDTGKK